MRTLAFNICSIITLIIFSVPLTAENPVNPVIGNESYIKKFGCAPNSNTPEDLRIKTHLTYVYGILSTKSVNHLSAEMKKRRTYILTLLKNYVNQGKFPKNYDKNDRYPCFIDKDGTICAVGYLVEQTAGRNVAEHINSNYQYSTIANMNDPILKLWIANSGLTTRECGMIQPSYGPCPPQPEPVHVTPAYGVSSSVFTGANLTLSTVNAVQIGNGSRSLATPIIGIATGIGQLSLGAAMYPAETYNYYGTYTTDEGMKTLSMVNIAVGSSTIALSTWNLINYCRNKKKNKSTSWGLYTYPASKTDVGFAFTFSHKF